MQSMQMHIGFNNAGTYKELGGKAEVASRNAAWTNAVGSIIGTQVTHVVVQQTLEIAGGLIANAEVNPDGSLTDKGRLYVEAGSIVARQLHDYDDGKSFGLGVTLTKKAGDDGKLKWGVGIPVVCGFDEQSRDIMPIIGSGEIRLTGGGDLPSELSRNVNSQIGATTGEHASLRATVPVSDMVEFISSVLNPQPQRGAVATGDDEEEGILQQILSWFRGEPQNTEYLNINIKPDERSIEEIAQLFDYTGMYIPIKLVKPSWQPKTLKDVYNSLNKDFGPGGRHQLGTSAYSYYLPLTFLCVSGELIDWGLSNIGYGISSIEGASETLGVIGYPINAGLGYVKGKIKERGKLVLGNEQYSSLAKWYSELPHGMQVWGTQASDGLILAGGGKLLAIPLDFAKASASIVLKAFEPVTISTLGAETTIKYSATLRKCPATFEGEVINFATREEAKLFTIEGNEAIKSAANKFFKEASNANLKGTNIVKNRNLKVTKMENGNITMEYIALSNKPGRTKRYIETIDHNGNKINNTIDELYNFKETINPRGDVIELKYRGN